MNKGKFIVFEGADCCGKSTAIENLKKYLIQKEEIDNFVFVSDPGSTGLGTQLRQILKHGDFEICKETQLLLFTASRAQLVYEKILPALIKGKHVICDRFLYSTLIYQCGFNIGEQDIIEMHKRFCCGIIPDVNIFFDIDFNTHLLRKHKNRQEEPKDRFEDSGNDFMKKIIEKYNKMDQYYDAGHIEHIDAKVPVSEVNKEILRIINFYCKNTKIDGDIL